MPRFLVDAAALNPSPGRTLLLAPSSSKVQRLLLPLPLGEGWGEGLPGTHPRPTPVRGEPGRSLSQARVEPHSQQHPTLRPKAWRLFPPLPVGEGRGEGLPGTHPRPTPVRGEPGRSLSQARVEPHSQQHPTLRPKAWRLFPPLPVGEGRGEGLPGTHPRPTPVRGEPGRSLSQARVEPHSQQHPTLRPKAWRLFPPLPVGEGRGEGLPGTHPKHRLSRWPHPPLPSSPLSLLSLLSHE